MKAYKLFSFLLLGSLILGGCHQDDGNTDDQVTVEPIREGDYGYSLPYVDSSTSVIHSKYGSNKLDTYFMGQQGLELTKQYFDPNTTYASEGSILEASELERFDSSLRGLGLLKYKTDYNPEGLNPEKGTYVESGTGINMYDAIIVSDIYEVDFVDENGDYVGFQFTIVMNENITYSVAQTNEDGSVATNENGDVILQSGTQTGQMSDDQLFNYGSLEAGQRLVNYLRNNHPEVGNLPIHVLLYKTVSSDSMTSGSFIGQSYVTTRSSTSYERLTQEWTFAPSTRLSELDSVLANQISTMKSTLFENFPTEVGFYGRVFFINNMAEEVEIEINMRGKTYVEIQSLIQYVVSLAPDINENSCELNIHVKSDGDTVALIHRAKNSETITTSLV